MAIKDPMFAQFPEHDAVISQWFERSGWPVTIRHYDFDREVLAWRHEGPTGNRTIRVTLTTVEDHPARHIVHLFDAANLAGLLVKHADKYIVLRRRADGAIGFDIFDSPP